MSIKTLNELVRDQILAEGPEIDPEGSASLPGADRNLYRLMCNLYVDEQLNFHMTNLELLERISAAHEVLDAKLLEQVKSWL